MSYTTFLFANPSFLEGAARVLDIGGTLDVYNGSASAEEADALAMWADWRAVGQDMTCALCEFEKLHKAQLEAKHGKK